MIQSRLGSNEILDGGLGVDYEMVELPNGDIIYIYKHLVPGQRVKLER